MKLIILNHKMNMEYFHLTNYINDLKKFDLHNNKLIVCPSNIYLSKFIEAGFTVGSQNSSYTKDGAMTGEVSAMQLKSLGVSYGIVGHSERKNFFKETHDMINKKLRLLLFNGIIPILCVGESKASYQSKTSKQELLKQLSECLDKLSVVDISRVVIAYEPVWSIGTGILPTTSEIRSNVNYIKDYILKNYKVIPKVIYGGSINSHNISMLVDVKELDGYLIGGSSLNIDQISDIIAKIS